MEAEKGQREHELTEFDSRRHDIECIRAAIADDRFAVSFLPTAGQLRVTLFKDEGGESQRTRAKAANKASARPTTLRKGIKSFGEAITEARFERRMELRQFFELFDIKVIVHDGYVEVRGIFPTREIGLDEVAEVSLLHSRSKTRRLTALGT